MGAVHLNAAMEGALQPLFDIFANTVYSIQFLLIGQENEHSRQIVY